MNHIGLCSVVLCFSLAGCGKSQELSAHSSISTSPASQKRDTVQGIMPESPMRIAIQPLGVFPLSLVDEARNGIQDVSVNAVVTVLQKQNLPKSAYYPPRKRYRALKLLAHLEANKDDSFDRVVGLTPNDISMTTEDEYDSGIIGVSGIGGDVCIISTYRLETGKPTAELFRKRLRAITSHELAHTLGLDHCPTKGCLMEDLKGRISTIDRGTWNFCTECRKELNASISNQ